MKLKHAMQLSAGALLAMIAAFTTGRALVAEGHKTAAAPKTEHAAKPHPKGPVAELMECPLAFAGVHLMKDDPREARVAYHFCKPVHAELNQCILYDGTGPDAKLIGIEYLVSDAIHRRMPAEERVYWHEHTFEVDNGLLKSLTMTGEEERQTLAAVRKMWGKVYHTWVHGEEYPVGPARLFWSVTGQQPFVLPEGAKLPAEVR